MSKLNVTFVASVKNFNGSTERPAEEDKNGEMPVILDVVAGKCPNKRVLSGTVALRAGMEAGKAYLMKCEEIDRDEYGRQFRFSTIKELGFSELLEAISHFKSPEVIEVVDEAKTKSGQPYPEGLDDATREMFDALTAPKQDAWLADPANAQFVA